LGASIGHGVDIDSYTEVSAGEVQEGDLLKVNCAPDARVLNADVSAFQVVLEISHAAGDESSLSRNPDDKVKIRKRQG
jgi:hypothetical protein